MWGAGCVALRARSLHLSVVNGDGMEREGSGGSEGSAGLLQQILSLKLVPRVGNGTLCPNSTSLCSFPGTGPVPPRACALSVLPLAGGLGNRAPLAGQFRLLGQNAFSGHFFAEPRELAGSILLWWGRAVIGESSHGWTG